MFTPTEYDSVELNVVHCSVPLAHAHLLSGHGSFEVVGTSQHLAKAKDFLFTLPNSPMPDPTLTPDKVILFGEFIIT